MDIFDTVVREVTTADTEAFEIGRSVCGLPLIAAHRGSKVGPQIIVTAGIHARECYTALVVLEQLKRWNGADGGGSFFVPLVNPDGALFFERGETFGRPFLKKRVGLSREWKANADGVDLNCNFPANHGTGRYNKRVAGASDYIGEYPLSAPEAAALAGFTERVKPAATVSYHCMGGELYWEFFQGSAARKRDKALATAIAKEIGVRRVDGDLQSAGGYKDFCVQRLGIPAFTIELIASGSHPFSPQDFEPDIIKNASLPQFILSKLETE